MNLYALLIILGMTTTQCCDIPSLEPSPKVVVTEHSDAVLNCSCSKHPSFITWQGYTGNNTYTHLAIDSTNSCSITIIDNDFLPNNTHITCSEDKVWFSITLPSVDRSFHGKKYRCQMLFTKYNDSRATSIYVRVPVTSVSINITESSVSVRENQPIAFKCTTSKERPRSTIQWYFKNANSPVQGVSISPEDNETLSATESLIQLEFSRNDSKSDIYCTAINTDDGTPAESNRKQIIVKYAPTKGPVIVGYSDGDDYSLIVSELQSLVCYVKGGYPDPTVEWHCFSGSTTDISEEGEVRKQVNWTTGLTVNGTCKCSSYQEVSGPKDVKINVIVLYPPTTPSFYANMTHNATGILKEIKGRTVDVTCVTSSFPKPFSYKWSKPSGPDGGDSDTIRLSNVQIEMAGSYGCTAKNKMVATNGVTKIMAASSQFTLEVLYPPEKPLLKFGSINISGTLSVIEGDAVKIDCMSTGEPDIMTYSWTGSTIGGSSLNFENIQAGDGGTYVCHVSNSMNPTVGQVIIGSAESSVMINVMGAPTIPNILYSSSTIPSTPLSSPQLVVIEGTALSLACTGSVGNPDPNHSWQEVETAVKGIVSFTNISLSDKNKYTCLARNMMQTTLGKTVHGENMTAVDIKVLYPPRFDQIGTQYVTENMELSLPCVANSNPLPFSYVWTRSLDAFNQTSKDLTIENIKRSETGNYTCKAKNMMHTTLEGQAVGTGSITVEVRVFYYPDIRIYQLNGTDIVEGARSVILLCRANADPTNYTFAKWIHFAPDGSTVIQRHDAIQDMNGQISLKFENAKIMDSGIYECSVTNGISDYRTGNLYASSNTTQVIKGRPVVTKSLPDVAAATRTNITLSVSFYSNDGTVPTVRWYRIENDTKQEINKTHTRVFYEIEADTVHVTYYNVTFVQPGNTSYLHIMDINGDDFEQYEAEISNSVDTTVSRIWLRAQGAPDTPTEFKIVKDSVTSSAVTVTWISGFHGGANQTFHIEYKSVIAAWQDGAEVEGFKLKNRRFQALIENLSSETQYFFRIYAENIHGNSIISTEIVTATTGSEPTDKTASSNVGLIAGGAAGGVALAAIMIALVLLLFRRRQYCLKSASKKLLKDNERPDLTNGAVDTPEINLNPMYESAGPLPSTSNDSGMYSDVDKKRKKKNPGGDIYSQVDKSKKRQNPSGFEVKNAVYAQVEKQTHKQKDAGKTKEKKQKPDTKTKKGKQTEGDIYDNVDTLSSTVTKGEIIYENPSCSIEDEHPKQIRNPDGLIYADLDLPKEAVGKGRKTVIHGLDDRTDYADIKYGEVGEQAHESDEENTNKNS